MEDWKKTLDSENFDMEFVESIVKMYFNNTPNIMTPYTVGYDCIFTKSRVVLFEKSSNGRGTLYGVTTLCYDRTEKTLQRIDLNYVDSTKGGIEGYIKRITLETIDTAALYGRKI